MDKHESFSWSGFQCIGSRSHFDLPRITLLNSHHSKQPKGKDDWVRNTVEAVQAHRDERIVLLSSTELPTWEFVVWLGGVYGIPQIIVVADYGITSRSTVASTILQEFELDSNLTTFLFIKGQSSRPKSWWTNRDELILNITDRRIPISIRLCGHLDDGLKTVGDAKGIDESFKISWSREQRRKPFQFDLETIRREVIHLSKTSSSTEPAPPMGPGQGNPGQLITKQSARAGMTTHDLQQRHLNTSWLSAVFGPPPGGSAMAGRWLPSVGCPPAGRQL